MHEASLMESILTAAEKRARDLGAARIQRITVRVGALSGVSPDALDFAFEALSPGTLAESGNLTIERVPIRCACRTCRREFQPDGPFFECPDCGQPTGEIIAGREMEIVSMEIP